MTDTTGTESRAARALEQSLVRFDLDAEIRRLADEPPGNDPERSTITLARTGPFRVVLSTLRAGTVVGGNETSGSLSILVVRGAATVTRGDQAERLDEGHLAVIEPGAPWRARAEADAALLLTVSWPESDAGPLA